jgi:hypothetical protein
VPGRHLPWRAHNKLFRILARRKFKRHSVIVIQHAVIICHQQHIQRIRVFRGRCFRRVIGGHPVFHGLRQLTCAVVIQRRHIQ